MPPIRILVVDDSVVIRKVLCDSLASDPDVEVAGTASDGRLALARIGQLKPDLITLDVEMPNMSGLEAIKEIRKLYPKLPIIMFSTLTERGPQPRSTLWPSAQVTTSPSLATPEASMSPCCASRKSCFRK